MKMNVIAEIIELLKIKPEDRREEAPIGNSKSQYYYSDGWRLYIWKSLWISSHDYSPERGFFTSIIVHFVDVFERADKIANTFPGGIVQLELDYLFPKNVNASWVFGHCGASCYGHTYWPLTLQIAKAECIPTGTLLAGTSVDIIDNNTEGVVENFLQDGGKAIMSAVKQVSDKRLREYTVCVCM